MISAIKLELFIATRYLLTKQKEKFVSVINIFSLVGVMLGVATLIVVMSVMNGYEKELLDKILGVKGHLTITTRQARIQNWQEIISTISSNVTNTLSIIPVVEQQALVLNNDKAGGVVIKGMLQNDILYKLKDKVIMLSTERNKLNNSIIIGDVLARNLQVDDIVKVVVPKFNQTMFGVVPRIKTYRVAGVFDFGMYEYNSGLIFMALDDAQKLFQFGDDITSIEITLKNIRDVSAVKQQLIILLRQYSTNDHDIIVIDWQQANQTLVDGLTVERNVMFLILSLIVVIAAFNIISSLVLLVRDKMRSIAILRTIGMQKGSIMRIFIICGFAIGIVGTALGVVLGVVFCIYMEDIRLFLEKMIGIKVFDPVIYFLTTLPVEVDIKQIIYIVLMSLLLSLLATIYPAWRVSLTSPAGVLRY